MDDNLTEKTHEQKLNQKANPVDEFSSVMKQRSQIPPPWLTQSEPQKKEWRLLTQKLESLSKIIAQDYTLSLEAKNKGIANKINKNLTEISRTIE